MTKHCEFCGNEHNKRGKYCSVACKQAAYRQRKGGYESRYGGEKECKRCRAKIRIGTLCPRCQQENYRDNKAKQDLEAYRKIKYAEAMAGIEKIRNDHHDQQVCEAMAVLRQGTYRSLPQDPTPIQIDAAIKLLAESGWEFQYDLSAYEHQGKRSHGWWYHPFGTDHNGTTPTRPMGDSQNKGTSAYDAWRLYCVPRGY